MTYSESDLKDSLDKEEGDISTNESEDEGLSPKEERISKDFQLKRALDLIKGLSLFKESIN